MLNFWGIYDDISVFQPIIDAYEKDHPNVKIVYTRKDASLYELASLNQLATQDGPDVWIIPSEWLPKHRDKLSPVPEGFLAKQNITPAPKKGLFAKPSPTPSNVTLYKQLYAPVTAAENIIDSKIAALPLSVDTLGLYVNEAKAREAGFPGTPSNWETIYDYTKNYSKHSGLTVTQPAIALGTANNISRATDILALLMMQNHTPMIDSSKTEAQFNQAITKATGEPIKPGELALDFYTSFASPTKETFNWTPSQPQDFDAFINGQLPLMIDYSYRIRDLTQQKPTFRFITGPMPQITGTDDPITLATSQMVGVPLISQHSAIAWDFIGFLTNQQNSLAYARSASRPPARLDLANPNLYDSRLAPFISQIGKATTWYRNNIIDTDTVFHDAINAVLAGQPVADVVDRMTKQITHILRNEDFQ